MYRMNGKRGTEPHPYILFFCHHVHSLTLRSVTIPVTLTSVTILPYTVPMGNENNVCLQLANKYIDWKGYVCDLTSK